MIYEGIEFFGVCDFDKKETLPGLILRRLPISVENKLGYESFLHGRFFGTRTPGAMMRFKTEAGGVYVSLSAWGENGSVEVYLGENFHSEHCIEAGKVTTLELAVPERYAQFQKRTKKRK